MKTSLAGYYSLLSSYLNHKTSYLIFFVTSRCNARCKMCFYWRDIEKAHEKKILTLEEIKRIAKSFKYLAYLSVTGGEPILRGDLDEIAHLFYKYSGTRFLTFSTNGLLPEKTEKTALSILEKCPGLSLKIYVSIDHIEGKHDEIRGVKGAFRKACDTLSRLKKIKETNSNISLLTETVLSSYNKDRITDIIDYIALRIKPDAQSIALARGDTRAKDAKDVTIAEYKNAIDHTKKKTEKKGLMHALLELTRETNFETLNCKKMILPCVAGRRLLTLTDDGLVLPCEMLKEMYPEGNFVMGDIRKSGYDINKVLNSRESRKAISFIKKSNCHCTFECATLCNVVFNPKTYPKILKGVFQ
ncbi:MAG: radical SAM protein [Omnitrophica bacterium]|nr:radical SAM protein [Candidatus Omnitrophota bacterium]